MSESYIVLLEPYCDGCPEFTVEVLTGAMQAKTKYFTCKHAKKCEKLVNFLKRSLEENGNQEK